MMKQRRKEDENKKNNNNINSDEWVNDLLVFMHRIEVVLPFDP